MCCFVLCWSWGSDVAWLTPWPVGAPPSLVRMLMAALLPITLPLPVALLLRVPSFLVVVLPLGFCLGLWALLCPWCGCSWALRCLSLCRLCLIPCSVRCLASLPCYLPLCLSWGSLVAYSWACGRSCAPCATTVGVLLPFAPLLLLAHLLCAMSVQVAVLPRALLLFGLRCCPCPGSWALLSSLCDCPSALCCRW